MSDPRLESFSTSELLREAESRLGLLKSAARFDWWSNAFAVVMDAYKLTMDQLREKSRREVVAEPRGVIFYLLMTHTTRNRDEIGALFQKSGDTVAHWLRKIRGQISVDPVFCAKISKIERDFEQLEAESPLAALRRASQRDFGREPGECAKPELLNK